MYKKVLFVIIAAVAVIFAGSAVQAYDDFGNRYQRIIPLAHELELAAENAHLEAERQAHHGNRREAYALERLHRLHEAAAHFHDEVEKKFRNPSHSERDFRILVSSFYDARSAMRGLHAFDHVYHDFGKVEQVMRGLVRVYSRYGNYYTSNRFGFRNQHHYGYDDDYDDHDDYDYNDEEYSDDDYEDEYDD
jgi:hypothetical protein